VGIGLCGLVIAAVAGWWFGPFRKATAAPDEARVAVLNRLRDEIKARYGFDQNGTPRVNRGPCGRFARAFREQWNVRFSEEATIVCLMLMSADGLFCGHVVVKFPDGSYFDGGHGVMSEQKLRALFPTSRLDEMVEFNLNLLDQRCDKVLNRRCDGLDFVDPDCPDYRDDLTAQLIKNHLELLPQAVNGN
jgi:hypothetical protein